MTTMSIKVTVAPGVRAGLYALVGARVTSPSPQASGDGGTEVANTVSGTIHGDVIQARDISGGININSNRRWRR